MYSDTEVYPMDHKQRRRFNLVVTLCIFVFLTLLVLYVMRSAATGTVAVGV